VNVNILSVLLVFSFFLLFVQLCCVSVFDKIRICIFLLLLSDDKEDDEASDHQQENNYSNNDANYESHVGTSTRTLLRLRSNKT